MKKALGRILALSLSVVAMAGIYANAHIPVSAVGYSEMKVGADSGVADDCVWSLDNNGVLTVSGNGVFDFPKEIERSNVKEVIIQHGVSGIDRYTFYSCENLFKVSISDSVEEIGEYAFANCPKLMTITVSPDNPVYDSRNNCNAIIQTNLNQLKFGCANTIIPSTVTSIGKQAFIGCSGLKKIEIPDNIKSIGQAAFSSCYGLTSVELPNNLSSIEKNTFDRCSSLTDISIPNSVTFIGRGAFSECQSLETIHIPSSVVQIEAYAFSSCEELQEISGGNGLRLLEADAFYNTAWWSDRSDGLVYFGNVAYQYKGECPQTVEVRKGTVSIADEAFEYQENLQTIQLSDELAYIGTRAFYECENLKSVSIPNTVTSIGTYAFYGCKNLNSVTGCSGLCEIGDYVFEETLWREQLPEGLNCLGKVAYLYKGDCPPVINISDGTVSIADNAFADQPNLKEVCIPDTVRNIGSSAFSGCKNLSQVSIGDEIDRIGSSAFYECPCIEYENGIGYIGRYACDCNTKEIEPNKTELTFREDTIGIADRAFSAKFYLTSYNDGRSNAIEKVAFPDGIRFIGQEAFQSNIALTEYYLPNSIQRIGVFAFFNKGGIGVIHSYSGSYAEKVCMRDGYTFEPIAEIIVLGDADNDGKVEVKDRVYLTRYLANWAGYENVNVNAADVNQDNQVNTKDRIILSRHLANWKGYESLPLK